MVAAEDYARRFESGDLADASGDIVEENGQGQSNSKVLCRMCLFGETEGSERAKKMLSCKSCGKKYHRSCLKNWSQNRDLFHWSSWTCPSCRICEICRRTGDPKKFMFCKRCDGAYHCYCQHPPHKNVSTGPYMCPKHTRCHSCGSNVPGNGLSVRWFLGYTCCDACGRLFVKGNYCPVCLKVYRDSESTPMVCCDLCQRWVHTQCDDISDEKYLQFQADGNLQYICVTCRGECYQVRDLEDAVQELWRRKDIADKDLIASLRAAAGLPTQEDIFSISPYSDDEENGPIILKSDHGRSLKFSLKSFSEKTSNKSKEGNKSNKKKFMKKTNESSTVGNTEPEQSFDARHDVQSSVGNLNDRKKDNIHLHKDEVEDTAFPLSGNIGDGKGVCSMNQQGVVKHRLIDEVSASTWDKKPRVLHIKSSKPQNVDGGANTGKASVKLKPVNEKKLVIHLGARNWNATNSPRSDASSCQREHELLPSNGIEDGTQLQINDRSTTDRHNGAVDGFDISSQSKVMRSGGKEGSLMKLVKVRSDAADVKPRSGGGSAGVDVNNSPEHPRIVFKRRSALGSIAASNAAPAPIVQIYRREKSNLAKQMEVKQDMQSGSNSDHSATPAPQPPAKESKPLLKLKFKNINRDSQSSKTSLVDEEKSSIKGQRSKRKRPSPIMGKFTTDGNEDSNQLHQDNLLDEIMDANWILKKLGKDAIGKKVEVHHQSDNSWHKGVVSDIVESKSALTVDLDDGRVKTMQLGKQGVRFVLQKQKRSRI
ncbi:hypothetical protein SAY87_031152 [Trapa incisa]|uniref:Uncharacterized protein n=1 Tax=Trapa incisa TaxID=236973 RepID=A0AAN7KVI2_9MYRT|nr:hypothetical protein SAY87_031152 [Trapa incisa]